MISVPKPLPREKKKQKRLAVRRDGIEAECDQLWQDCIKLRANFRSEKSGTEATVTNGKVSEIVGHHVAKKSNLWLRYSLDNGICLLESEHSDIHWDAPPKVFEQRAIDLVGGMRWVHLMDLKRDNAKRDITTVREDLKFTRQVLIEKQMKSGNTYLLNIYLKQIGVIL